MPSPVGVSHDPADNFDAGNSGWRHLLDPGRWFGRRGEAQQERLVILPTPLMAGDVARGRQILDGRLGFKGLALPFARDSAWANNAPVFWQNYAQSFAWLKDLVAVAAETGAADNAAALARALITAWLDRHGESGDDDPALTPLLCARRLVGWLDNYRTLVTGPGRSLHQRWLGSIIRQADIVYRAARQPPEDYHGLEIQLVAVYIALSLAPVEGDGERRLMRCVDLLLPRLDAEIYPDGGHRERSPRIQLEIFVALLRLTELYRRAERTLPPPLRHALDRMAPIVRLLRHGDGGLAQFNTTGASDAILEPGLDPAKIDQLLEQSRAPGKAPHSAPHIGFERLNGGRTVVIIDAASPSPIGSAAHAGTLSFEMSHGSERLIVNCGAYPNPDSPWALAQKLTAAHSVMVLNDTNSAELSAAGLIGRMPTAIKITRDDSETGSQIALSHNGYVPIFGATYQRRLWLAASGDVLIGEELITDAGVASYALRFHLHPMVKASLLQDGSAALLKLPGAGFWHLRTTSGALTLDESVYLDGTSDPKRTMQIVIEGNLIAGGVKIEWKLAREPK